MVVVDRDQETGKGKGKGWGENHESREGMMDISDFGEGMEELLPIKDLEYITKEGQPRMEEQT